MGFRYRDDIPAVVRVVVPVDRFASSPHGIVFNKLIEADEVESYWGKLESLDSTY